MVFHGPGFRGGNKVQELVSLVDIPATILKASEAAIPDDFDGAPIQDAMTDPNQWKRDIFVQISENSLSRALRTKHYKYAVKAPGYQPWKGACETMSSDIYIEDELYDLSLDPIERHNRIDDPKYTHIKQDLRERLIKRMVQAGEEKPQILDYSTKADD
jgi:arylsulfatase A-like enzyme